LSPAKLAVALYLPFLESFTLILAIPFELVLALKVLFLILSVITLPATAFPLDF
jgi:hypothetical protein